MSRQRSVSIEFFEVGFDHSDSKVYYFQTMGFMHSMMAGYTSFETGMKRLLSMLDELIPSTFDSHVALVRRLAANDIPTRPAVLDRADLHRAIDRLRGFRHVAAHVYDFFNEDLARLAVGDAKIFVAEIGPAIDRFRAAIDPD